MRQDMEMIRLGFIRDELLVKKSLFGWDGIEAIEIAGPGVINVHLKDKGDLSIHYGKKFIPNPYKSTEIRYIIAGEVIQ